MRSLLWLIFFPLLWIQTGCTRNDPSSTASPSGTENTRHDAVAFDEVAGSLGISFTQSGDGVADYFFPAIMAGGAAVSDVDQDGDLDVLLLDSWRGDRMPEPGRRVGAGSVLYLQASDGRFTDATPGSGFETTGFATGCATGDVNNDGLPDIYVTAWGPDQFYLNKRGGVFQLMPNSAGLANDRWGTSATFLDYDRDGWLDLFVANYVEYDPGHDCIDNGGRRDFCNPIAFSRTTDRLFRNVTGARTDDAEIRFEDVTHRAGITSVQGAGLGVVAADFDGDGWIDVYVANDGHSNFLWINQKDGTFAEQAVLKGVASDNVGQGQGSMGLAIGELNGDGLADIVVTNLDGESNAVYRSFEFGYQESSMAVGVHDESFGKTGFGTTLLDVENDGDLDLFVVNGRVRRNRLPEGDSAVRSAQPVSNVNEPVQELSRDYGEHASILLNESDGFRAAALESNSLDHLFGVGRSLCQGDINNDGLVDVLVTYLDRPAALLLNRTPVAGHWLSVRAIEPSFGDRDAIGAVVSVTADEKRRTRWLASGGSYQCASDVRLHFGLGPTAEYQYIDVVWPNGEAERFAGGAVDQFVTLKHGEGSSLMP